MIKVIKAVFICGMFLISCCEVSFLQSAESKRINNKKDQSTISFERSKRAIALWMNDINSMYEPNSRLVLNTIIFSINLLERRWANEGAFWIVGYGIRKKLKKWMEMPHIKEVKDSKNQMDRLYAVFCSCDTSLSQMIFADDEDLFYRELRSRELLCKETVAEVENFIKEVNSLLSTESSD